MGEFNDTKEEEQPMRKRPRTMGLKRALEKKKEEEAALVRSYPLTSLLTQEIKNNREAWLERENKHLEDKMERANRDLSLQRKMTRHYKKLNQFARRKLKVTQEKLKAARKRHPVEKVGKDTSKLEILASASLHVSENA